MAVEEREAVRVEAARAAAAEAVGTQAAAGNSWQ
jgi:hypothetical protein